MTVQFRRRNVRSIATDPLARPTRAATKGFADQQLSLMPPPVWPGSAADEVSHDAVCRDCPRKPPPPQDGVARRLLRAGAKLCYRMVRPVLRPLAWRARGFLLQELLPPVLGLQDGQAAISATLSAIANRQSQIHDAIRLPSNVVAQPLPMPSRDGRSLTAAGARKVHQFHAGSATGDAITNAMLLIRDRLRRQGYDSEIYVEHLGIGLKHELLPLDALPIPGDHVLLVHHSMGHARFHDVLASPAPKVLIYHNITPAELLTHDHGLQQAARLGRVQLRQWRGEVCAALADSVLNGQELRRLGFAEVREASLLFDVQTLRDRAARGPAQRGQDPYTVLFIGRVVSSKGQAELVDAFARFLPAFRRETGRNARLVLVGAADGEASLRGLTGRIAAHGLGEEVLITGKVSDAMVQHWYTQADLYVSLSRHEGFGVPLIEALAYGVKVVALANSAVPYTLVPGGDHAAAHDHCTLLHDDDPDHVAQAMLAASRADLNADARDKTLEHWRLERHWPILEQALARAGAASAPQASTLGALIAGQHLAVTGQINGSYSLAAVNRRLATALESAMPGRVRLLPFEDGAPAVLAPGSIDDMSRGERATLAMLAVRPAALSGPVVAISQHYPLLVPDLDCDAAMALLFWEETLLPAETVRTLNRSFAAVFAPSLSVARALADSGVHVPIRHIGFSPDLRRFAAVAEKRRCQPPRGGGITTFLHVSSCFPRKGVDVLLAAWARAFRADDSVRLVIKGFPNPHNDIADQVTALCGSDPDIAAISFINRDLRSEALLALYADADVMVLPSRGEGYNIPAAEALAAGLRLIVTGFGGHMDFCEAPDCRSQVRLLEYRLARSASHVASRHALWAEPDEDDLVRALREAACASAIVPRRASRSGPASPRWRDDAWAGRIAQVSAEILMAPKRSRPSLVWVTPWQQACGVAEYSRHLLTAMPEDAEFPIILADERPPIVERAADRLPRGRAAFRFGDSASAPELALAIATEDADVVMLQHQPGLLPWDGLAQLLESPLLLRRCIVITLHNTRHLLLTGSALRARVAASLARVRRVLVHTIEDLATLQDLGVTNTTLLPHGTTGGPPPRPPRDFGDAPIIGSTGFALPHKGLARLIEAAYLLRADWPDIRLRLVCARYPDPRSDQEIERCRELARALDIEDAVEWHTQFLSNEKRLDMLSACDLVVMPYAPNEESASGAVRQALASGTPTLVSDLSVFMDLDDAVERATVSSPAALARDIQALLRSPERRTDLQRRAQLWLADHAWSTIAERLDGMLNAYHQEHRQEAVDALRAG